LIPDLMRSFIDNKPCLIRSPTAIRPWQFVLEPLRGYLMLAERLVADPSRFGSAWNFGPADSDARPVSWIADALVNTWGGSAGWCTDAAVHPREARFLKLDISRARSDLGWQPALPLATALSWIVEWYRLYERGGNLERLTRDQIEQYGALLGK
jgi:CDP-glucose 4,6-dehydratase